MACQNDQPAMPYSAVEVSRRDGVGADGEEGDEAQVEQARQAEGDVEAEAHQHVQRDERDDLGEERAQRQREEQDQGQDEERERCRSTSAALGRRQGVHPLARIGRSDQQRRWRTCRRRR